MRTDRLGRVYHTGAERDTALALYARPLSCAAVSRLTGIPGRTIATWAELAGVLRRRGPAHVVRHGKRTVGRLKRLAMLAHLSHAAAGRELGVTGQTVRRWRAMLAKL